MLVLFLFPVCINRYTNAKQLQFCVTDTDVEQVWKPSKTLELPK